MSVSPIVSLLASRPPEELEALRGKMKAEQEKHAAELARLDIELQQVDDALARQNRRRGAKNGRTASGPTAQDLVWEIVSQSEVAVTPAQAHEALKANEQFTGTRSAVYNAFHRLVGQKKILKLESGGYVPAEASAGAPAEESPAEPTDLGPGGIPGATSGEPAGTAETNRS